MDAEPPSSALNSRRGSMLRRTVSFTDLYSRSPPTDSDQPSPSRPPNIDNGAAPALPRTGGSSSGPYAMVRSMIYSKAPRTVRKDPRTAYDKRLAARFVIRYDFDTVIWRIVNAKRRDQQAREAAERLAAVQRAAEAAAAERAAEADRLLFTPPTPHRPFDARELPWFAARVAADKRKHDDDDNEPYSTKRARVQAHIPPPSTSGDATAADDPSTSSFTVATETAALAPTSPAAAIPSAPALATTTATTSTVAIIPIATPTATVITTSIVTAPQTATPVTTVPATVTAATIPPETTMPGAADNAAVPPHVVVHTSTTAVARRRHSNASLAGQASSSSSQTSAAAGTPSANTRLRRHASEPALVIYRDSDETEPEEPPPQDARKAKKARRGSLKAKENRGQRRNSANDPIQN